jgi:hypothetical protein
MRYEACMEEVRSAYKSLFEITEKKRPLGRRRCKRESNIKMDVKEMSLGSEDVD